MIAKEKMNFIDPDSHFLNKNEHVKFDYTFDLNSIFDCLIFYLIAKKATDFIKAVKSNALLIFFRRIKI